MEKVDKIDKNEKNVIVSLGEIMLRLKSPGHERLFQSPMLEATFGGGEANVAISLANFGLNTRFITNLPQNAIGDSCLSFLRSMNVDTSHIGRKGTRLGIYFLETGSGPRQSMVIYDRANSAIAESKSEDFEFKTIFKDAAWFHITGITPALSASAANLSLTAVKAAKDQNVKVSCDLNFRKKLWQYGKSAPEIMHQLMNYVDIVIANEEDIQKSLGMTLDQQIGGAKLDRTKYEMLAKAVVQQYPHVQIVAITLRESFSADHNDWAAMCYLPEQDQTYFSKKYALTDIIDRVGGGDSFGAGFIYGLYNNKSPQDALDFAVAASALKHTIPGDINRVSVNEVNQLVRGDSSGRVQR